MGRNFIRLCLTPGNLPPKMVLIASLLIMLVVFIFDVISPADIRLHTLYIFPLAAIALHCEWKKGILGGLALSVAFQLSNFVLNGILIGPFITDALIAFASSLLTVLLARAARKNYLETAKLATHDSLTGLYNRRRFETIADLEVARLKRYGSAFSLAVIDLDNFKELNDSSGHHVGDQALNLLADILREHRRQTDTIARLGGDEFAVLMPHTPRVYCQSLCQQLSETIESRMGAAEFNVTASIGFSTFEQAPESTLEALKIADKAMYAAKANGKNCAEGFGT